MTYAIDRTDVADMEATEIFLWIIGRSPANAGKWQAGLEDAINSLREFPRRCPIAYEDRFAPYEIRQHLYGKYRILFTLLDSDGDGIDDTVRILHVRHGAMEYLDP